MRRAATPKRIPPKSPSKAKTFANRPGNENTTIITNPEPAQPPKRQQPAASQPKNQGKGKSPAGRPAAQKSTEDSPRVELHDFLKFPENIKQEQEEMPKAAEEVEELLSVDFDMNGVTVTARMSSSTIQLMNDDETFREQIFERLMVEHAENPGESICLTMAQPDQYTSQTTVEVSNPGNEQSGQTSPKVKNNVQAGPKTGRGGRGQNPFKRKIVPAEGIPSMWGDATVKTLLEVYEFMKDKSHQNNPPAQFFWQAVCKQMIKKGYVRVTEKECRSKFESMEEEYKDLLEQGATPETATWKFFKQMHSIMNGDFRPKPLNPVADPVKVIVDPRQSAMYSAGVSSSEDNDLPSEDDLDFDTLSEPPKRRKQESTDDLSDIEMFRRTYLKVQKKKLEEMKTMRKLQRQHNRLQAERNVILSSAVEILRKTNIITKKR